MDFYHIKSYLYKILVNTLIIVGCVLIPISGYKLFTNHIYPLARSLAFIMLCLIFAFGISLFKRNKLRRPKFKNMLFLLILIATVFAFAGMEPFYSFKNKIWDKLRLASTAVKAELDKLSGDITSSQSSTERAVTPTLTASPKSPSAAPPQSVQPGADYTIEDVEDLIHILINAERQKVGLASLNKDSSLASLAKEHSVSMASKGFFSHDRAVGERPFSYGQAPGTTRGENISETPQRKWIPGPYLTLKEVSEWAVSGWMNSAGHRQNILNPRFTKTGVGVSRLGEHLYITQMFEGPY